MATIQPVTRLSSSIIRILGCNPGQMTLQGTNTYLLGTGERRILIDTGDKDVPEYLGHLQNVLKEENARISTIILTHWHHDHVGGVGGILKSYADQVKFKVDCEVYKYPRTDAADICEEIPDNVEVKQLRDLQEFAVDGAKVRVVHTPGHTTDHVILTTDDGTLFSGDCILGEGTAVFEDLYDYMNSLLKILSINPKVIYPGHGNIINDPRPKIEYYIAHRKQREEQIFKFFYERPKQKLQPMDVVKVVYKDTPEQLWPAAAYNVSHHLTKLYKEGKLDLVKAADDEDVYVYHGNAEAGKSAL